MIVEAKNFGPMKRCPHCGSVKGYWVEYKLTIFHERSGRAYGYHIDYDKVKKAGCSACGKRIGVSK